MASIILRDKTKLSDFGKPYVVAEINTSHFGNLDLAKEMVVEAKKVGCDCVKFQSWSSETLYSQSYYDDNPIAERFVKKFSISKNELKEIADFCAKIGIGFSSTPYSKDEVKFLVDDIKSHYLKVASMDLNNYPYLSFIAKTGIPIVLSTGMSDIKEIRKAVKTIEGEGNKNICLLHCVSIYPPKTSNIQLNNILGLREEFPKYPIGYSDHSIGSEIATASIALGACMVEKHFTLDKKKIGMDNHMAAEPKEMSEIVDNCQKVQIALGKRERNIHKDEIEQRKIMRRSIIITRDLKAGDKLSYEVLDVKRPGTGIPPEKIDNLVGKTLNKDIKSDCIIKKEDFYE